jgi:hypothetical protein
VIIVGYDVMQMDTRLESREVTGLRERTSLEKRR